MFFSDATRSFRWADKFGLVWDVYVIEDEKSLSWYAMPNGLGGRYSAYVETHDYKLNQMLTMARLIDVRVSKQLEDRGVGSLLVGQAITECKQRGHRGIGGDLSTVDGGHFDKLEYFYKRLGFSVIFYEPSDPLYKPPFVGRIEMIF